VLLTQTSSGVLYQQYTQYAGDAGVSPTQPWSAYVTVVSNDGQVTFGTILIVYDAANSQFLVCRLNIGPCPTPTAPIYSITITYGAMMGLYNDYLNNNLYEAAYDYTTDMGMGTLSWSQSG
jgi:hypothetical protein